MNKYITLLGAEQVQSAANTMTRAAESMQSAANNMQYAHEQHQRFLDDWLQRYQQLLEKDRDDA